MGSSDKKRARLVHTPLLDRELARLNRALRPDGTRADLIRYMRKMNGRSDRMNGNRLSELIHRRRMPNGETLLILQRWLKSRNNRK